MTKLAEQLIDRLVEGNYLPIKVGSFVQAKAPSLHAEGSFYVKKIENHPTAGMILFGRFSWKAHRFDINPTVKGNMWAGYDPHTQTWIASDDKSDITGEF